MVVFVGVDVVVDENGVGEAEIVGVVGTKLNAVSSNYALMLSIKDCEGQGRGF